MSLLSRPHPFHVITKPIGAVCNLDCQYCFYLSKRNLYPDTRNFKMQDDVLEEYIKQYIQQPAQEITFTWQGGEPTLMGLEFYKKVVKYQEKHNPDGKVIHNSLQTNGTNVDNRWARFFHDHDFLIGVSIDGPARFHNKLRYTKGGRDTHANVLKGISYLQKHDVEYNILCCLNRYNADHPFELYEFFKEESGTPYWQFIPIVEGNPHAADGLADYSILPEQYGDFLVQIFNRWVRNDLGTISIRIFDTTFRVYMGLNPALCVFEESCGSALAIEHNGDLYSCDHYVETDYKLGNLMETDLNEMVTHKKQRKFGLDKKDTLPEYCRECNVRFLCNGGCPKNRINETPSGEKGLNYLCSGYMKFFRHIAPYFKFTAQQFRSGMPVPKIMDYIHANPQQFVNQEPGRNDLCYCGSGKKYKKCCG